jgi:hypothetical protein
MEINKTLAFEIPVIWLTGNMKVNYRPPDAKVNKHAADHI